MATSNFIAALSDSLVQESTFPITCSLWRTNSGLGAFLLPAYFLSSLALRFTTVAHLSLVYTNVVLQPFMSVLQLSLFNTT